MKYGWLSCFPNCFNFYIWKRTCVYIFLFVKLKFCDLDFEDKHSNQLFVTHLLVVDINDIQVSFISFKAFFKVLDTTSKYPERLLYPHELFLQGVIIYHTCFPKVLICKLANMSEIKANKLKIFNVMLDNVNNALYLQFI